jgi:hypothetical protein
MKERGLSLPSSTTTTATAESTTAGATLGSLVDADGATIEPKGQLAPCALYVHRYTHSTLFMALMAASASASWP